MLTVTGEPLKAELDEAWLARHGRSRRNALHCVVSHALLWERHHSADKGGMPLLLLPPA